MDRCEDRAVDGLVVVEVGARDRRNRHQSPEQGLLGREHVDGTNRLRPAPEILGQVSPDNG